MLNKLSELLHSWAKGWIVLMLLVLLVGYIAVTLPVLTAAPGGDIESLDAQFFYTPEEAFSTIALYGNSSSFWICMYLTWDVITPILYSLLFSLTISWLLQHSFKPGKKVHIINSLPIGAGFCDLLENVCIVVMLSLYPTQPVIIAWLSTIFTMSKMILLAISTLLILSGLGTALSNRFRKST